MVQAGLDVLAVVVALLLVEGCFGTQALESSLQLHQLCLPSLPMPALIADVLEVRGGGRGSGGPSCPESLRLATVRMSGNTGRRRLPLGGWHLKAPHQIHKEGLQDLLSHFLNYFYNKSCKSIPLCS